MIDLDGAEEKQPKPTLRTAFLTIATEPNLIPGLGCNTALTVRLQRIYKLAYGIVPPKINLKLNETSKELESDEKVKGQGTFYMMDNNYFGYKLQEVKDEATNTSSWKFVLEAGKEELVNAYRALPKYLKGTGIAGAMVKAGLGTFVRDVWSQEKDKCLKPGAVIQLWTSKDVVGKDPTINDNGETNPDFNSYFGHAVQFLAYGQEEVKNEDGTCSIRRYMDVLDQGGKARIYEPNKNGVMDYYSIKADGTLDKKWDFAPQDAAGANLKGKDGQTTDEKKVEKK